MPPRAHQGAAARRPGQREWRGCLLGWLAVQCSAVHCCSRRGQRGGRLLQCCCGAGGAGARPTVPARLPTSPAPQHALQHGEGLGEKFSVDYIFMDAAKRAGGTPATGVDEKKWLDAFLAARYDLLNSWDATSRASLKRITMYQKLAQLGEWEGVEGGRAGRSGTGQGQLVAGGPAPACPLVSCRRRASPHLPLTAPAGNYNLDGPIYIDLEQRTSPDGTLVWQIKDTYYGKQRGAAAGGGRQRWAEGEAAVAEGAATAGGRCAAGAAASQQR